MIYLLVWTRCHPFSPRLIKPWSVAEWCSSRRVWLKCNGLALMLDLNRINVRSDKYGGRWFVLMRIRLKKCLLVMPELLWKLTSDILLEDGFFVSWRIRLCCLCEGGGR